MDRELILKILREHAAELQAAGVAHLRLFGSVVRGEAGPGSDVDLLVDFDQAKRVTLVSMGSLEHRLGNLLSAKVELSSAASMRAPIRDQVLQEAVVAF